MSLSSKSNNRSGFTLVEILVVITIIGILVSLLVPTLAAALQRSREGAIAFEIKQLQGAIESFRKERVKKPNFYPPDFSDLDAAGNSGSPAPFGDGNAAVLNKKASELQAFVRVMSRNANQAYVSRWVQNKVKNNSGNDVTVFQAPIISNTNQTNPPNPLTLDPAEALVFWLGMTQKNPEAPLPSRFARPSGPGMLPPAGNGTWTFFEFDESRLVDQDNDGWPEYLQAHGEEAPYLYFSSHYEFFNASNNLVFADAYDGHARGQGIARPYFGTSANAAIPVSGTENKFQIIAAGYDGVFSVYNNNDPNAQISARVFDGNRRRKYPTGVNFSEFDLDNLCSFAEGRVDNKMD